MKSSGLKSWFKEGRHLLLVISISLIVLLIILDVITKNIAYYSLDGKGTVVAIPYIFNFVLVFNNGAAWNILAGQEWVLCLLSAVLGTAILVFLYWRFKKLPTSTIIALSLMVAGAYGNLIDRIGQAGDLGIYADGVIDFIQFAFWTSFPVFNLADSYLVIGIVVLLISLIVLAVRDHRHSDEKKRQEIRSNDALMMKLKEDIDPSTTASDDGKPLKGDEAQKLDSEDVSSTKQGDDDGG